MRHLPPSALLRSAASLLVGGALLAACGDKARSTDAAEESSSKKEPASKADLTAPKDVDAKVTEALEKLASCERDENGMKDCPAGEAWTTFLGEYANDDDDDASKAKKLARSCLANVGHKSPNVRDQAASCVQSYDDELEGVANALDLVLAQLEVEKERDVQYELAEAVAALDPQKRKAGDRVLAFLKKTQDADQPSWGTMLQALGRGTPPHEGAYDLAKGILEADKGTIESAIYVVEANKARKAEGCKLLLKKIETGKRLWARAVNGAGILGCQDEVGAIVDVVVKKMAEKEGYDQGFLGADFVYFERMLDDLKLDAGQVAKVKKAATDLKAASTRENVKKDCDELIERLAKE